MKSFNSILYVVENPTAEPISSIERVVSLAENNQAHLTVMHVVEEPRLGPFFGSVEIEDVISGLREQAIQQLQPLLQSVQGSAEILIDIRFGTAFIEIIKAVLRNRHDLVIKTEGEGGAHSFLFGGTDQHLLRKCPCPVWILAGETSANYRRVLAAVDFDPWEESEEDNRTEDELNRQIVGFAASLAASDFAQLHVVHAWQSISDNMVRIFSSDISEEERAANRERERREHQSRLELLDKRIREELGGDDYGYIAPRFHLCEGMARDVIPGMATELQADLVVMGTVSRTGVPGLLIGNTAEVILNNLECSVLAVKPADFVTPVSFNE
jgi:nucleotide-binding universal stress UspA family protein